MGETGTGHRRPRPHDRAGDGEPGVVVVPPVQLVEPRPLVSQAEVHANRRRARLLAGSGALVPALVVGVLLGVAVSGLVGLAAAVVVFLAGTAGVLRLATPVALALIGARPVSEGELVRLENLVDGLCPTFGVRKPTLMVLDDPVPNACCVGGSPDPGVLVVTTALAAALDLIELEGVVAHELAHLKRADAVVSAVAMTVLAPITWLSGSDRLLHRVLGPGRELCADRVAVLAVRYPPGLGAALEKFEASGEPGPESFFSGRRLAMSRWLWVDPSIGRRQELVLGDLDRTGVRVRALAEA